nr:MAG TPA: hypothetical protein [Caudoviricetes sp.]
MKIEQLKRIFGKKTVSVPSLTVIYPNFYTVCTLQSFDALYDTNAS